MIERQFCHHPFLTFAAGMVCSAILALPAAFLGWHWVILPGLAEEMKVREQMAEGKGIIVTLSGIDKNCLDWREKNGAWSCVRR